MTGPQLIPDERQQSSIARAQIESPQGKLRDKLQQSRFTLLPMGNGIGSLEIVRDVLARGP